MPLICPKKLFESSFGKCKVFNYSMPIYVQYSCYAKENVSTNSYTTAPVLRPFSFKCNKRVGQPC